MTDKELSLLIVNEPEKGIRLTVRLYSAYVYKIMYNKLANACSREDIEEAVSDVFLKLYRFALKQQGELKSVSAALAVIAKNHANDVYRAKLRELKTVPLDEISELPADEICAEPDELINMIKDLGEPDTEIFIRKYILGQNAKEIGRDIGMRPNSVNKRISRGLVRLREMFKEGEK